MDIWGRNGRTREGKQLYNDQTPNPEKVTIIMQHLGKTLLPTTQPFQRTKKAITGEPGRGAEIYEIPYELAGIFGFRLIKVDPKKSLGFKLFEYQQGVSNSRKLFTGEIDPVDMRTPSDVIDRYFTANKSLFEVKKKMLTSINNAKALGIKDDDIYEIFDKRGLGSIYNEITSGEFIPFFPSRKIIERFEDLSKEGGVSNVYNQAESTLGQMEDQMYKLNLYQDWNISLDDFLPDTDPQGQSALPQMPMPNQRLFTRQNNQINNLTRSEQALLSPEEQEIARRT